jgi:NitT/TauT family transport system permease protein
LDSAKTLELKGFHLFFNVILPASSPHILSGASTSLIFSFILLTVAEIFGVNSGLGYFVQYYADFSDYPRVIAGMVFMSAFIVILLLIFDKIKKRILHWTINKE